PPMRTHRGIVVALAGTCALTLTGCEAIADRIEDIAASEGIDLNIETTDGLSISGVDESGNPFDFSMNVSPDSTCLDEDGSVWPIPTDVFDEVAIVFSQTFSVEDGRVCIAGWEVTIADYPFTPWLDVFEGHYEPTGDEAITGLASELLESLKGLLTGFMAANAGQLPPGFGALSAEELEESIDTEDLENFGVSIMPTAGDGIAIAVVGPGTNDAEDIFIVLGEAWNLGE
ncbi:MAG: hypothetical protein R3249_10160, partial [Nitriliruptorales bacterium]|nr:hypothetical protein [Nitriliruptorales bacterium]